MTVSSDASTRSDQPAPTLFDRFTERISRWLAARSTRRSFLAGTGKVALVAAGGTTLLGVFARRAEARVCGQSGVSPKCPTFDCFPPSFWGWCWYASPGCCANGGIKKICDCCRTNHPNVQGYCPAGSAVYCVVESCLEDPRAMRLNVERVPGESLAAISLGRSVLRPAASAPRLVLAEADPLMAAVASPVAGHLGVPLLLVDPAAPFDPVLAEIRRLATTGVVVVGVNLTALEFALQTIAPVERVSVQGDVASMSVEIAAWLLRRTQGPRAYCIGAGVEALVVAPSVAAMAAGDHAPILITAAAAGAIANGELGPGVDIVYVGTEAIDASPSGSTRVSGSPSEISRAFATRAAERAGSGSIALAVVPTEGAFGGLALASPGGAVLLHPNGGLGNEQRDWCIANRQRIARIEITVSRTPSLTEQGVYDIQSALNGFDAHQLRGVSGEGLPVIVQPVGERPIGRARVSGPLPAPPPTTLVNRGNPSRIVPASPASGTLSTTVAASAPPSSALPSSAPNKTAVTTAKARKPVAPLASVTKTVTPPTTKGQ